jgi:SNF2 family DNA or RNA helicase
LGDKKRLEITPDAFSELVDAGVEFENSERIKTLAQRLKRFMEKNKTVSAVETAPGFSSSLRSYQKEGLGWIEFLSECQAGGILADDMGLGKTVQTLAHIWKMKVEGRLNKPILIVCPTSVVQNWLSEAQKHSPELKVLSLTGPERENKFPLIKKFDIAVSTYALLHRDTEKLLPVEWSMVVLDEAQYIKNPATQAAAAAFKLQAETRLCLTGTPVENHLGELWSQFNFIAPGLLGTLKSFTNKYRTPIEKAHDKSRQKLLARRISPFLLRRTKAQVAEELPEKTIIIQPVELEGAQRDLYETVRLAMDERIRDEIALKGFKRSQIVILDALLKLRQVCCDPRLVKLDAAKRAGRGSKLSELMDVLPQLVESGRKVLLFSQFTSMLDLIAAELDDNKISYVQLRGDTRDRATPVKRFQNGDVPVFLISLKAGGTGLNLTAADTVIHYDPWWNPAVENQATDRAHRIGQDKPVFVYKMIATGTIEERILEMQKRKQAIADAVFDADRAGTVAITEDDLAYLLAPIDARSSAASAKPVKNKQSASVSLSNNPASTDRSRSNSRLKNVKKRDNSLVMSITIDELDAGTLDRPSSRSSKSSDNNGDGDIEPIDPFARALLKHGVSPKDLVLAFTPPNKNRSTNKNPKRAAKK